MALCATQSILEGPFAKLPPSFSLYWSLTADPKFDLIYLSLQQSFESPRVLAGSSDSISGKNGEDTILGSIHAPPLTMTPQTPLGKTKIDHCWRGLGVVVVGVLGKSSMMHGLDLDDSA